MKKTIKCTVLMLAITMAMSMFSFTVSAASTKSAIRTRADKETSKLVKYAEFYGWSPEVKVTKNAASQVKKVVKLSNSKYTFTINQLTKKSGSNFKNVFKIHGKSYSLAGIKHSLKQYAVKTDIKKLLEDKAGVKADSLAQKASKNQWTMTSSTHTYKNGTAAIEQMFKNSKYQFTATVRATRKNGKVVLSYLRNGKTCKVSDIEAWLTNYKADPITVGKAS